jgi:hypothetical protein
MTKEENDYTDVDAAHNAGRMAALNFIQPLQIPVSNLLESTSVQACAERQPVSSITRIPSLSLALVLSPVAPEWLA